MYSIYIFFKNVFKWTCTFEMYVIQGLTLVDTHEYEIGDNWVDETLLLS